MKQLIVMRRGAAAFEPARARFAQGTGPLRPPGGRIRRAGLRCAAGAAWFAERGIDTAAAASKRRVFCRPCLDRGERRHHLGGALGTALLERLLGLGWARRAKDSRVIHFTPRGEPAVRALFAAA